MSMPIPDGTDPGFDDGPVVDEEETTPDEPAADDATEPVEDVPADEEPAADDPTPVDDAPVVDDTPVDDEADDAEPAPVDDVVDPAPEPAPAPTEPEAAIEDPRLRELALHAAIDLYKTEDSKSPSKVVKAAKEFQKFLSGSEE